MTEPYAVFHDIYGVLRLVGSRQSNDSAIIAARQLAAINLGQRYVVMMHIFSVQTGPYEGGVDG